MPILGRTDGRNYLPLNNTVKDSGVIQWRYRPNSDDWVELYHFKLLEDFGKIADFQGLSAENRKTLAQSGRAMPGELIYQFKIKKQDDTESIVRILKVESGYKLFDFDADKILANGELRDRSKIPKKIKSNITYSDGNILWHYKDTSEKARLVTRTFTLIGGFFDLDAGLTIEVNSRKEPKKTNPGKVESFYLEEKSGKKHFCVIQKETNPEKEGRFFISLDEDSKVIATQEGSAKIEESAKKSPKKRNDKPDDKLGILPSSPFPAGGLSQSVSVQAAKKPEQLFLEGTHKHTKFKFIEPNFEKDTWFEDTLRHFSPEPFPSMSEMVSDLLSNEAGFETSKVDLAPAVMSALTHHPDIDPNYFNNQEYITDLGRYSLDKRAYTAYLKALKDGVLKPDFRILKAYTRIKRAFNLYLWTDTENEDAAATDDVGLIRFSEADSVILSESKRSIHYCLKEGRLSFLEEKPGDSPAASLSDEDFSSRYAEILESASDWLDEQHRRPVSIRLVRQIMDLAEFVNQQQLEVFLREQIKPAIARAEIIKLVNDRGFGKTALLNFMAMQPVAMEALLGYGEDELLPYIVCLRCADIEAELTSSKESAKLFTRIVLNKIYRPADQRVVDQFVEDRNVMLICLDGFDETRNPEHFAKYLQQWIEANPGLRLIIGSRPIAALDGVKGVSYSIPNISLDDLYGKYSSLKRTRGDRIPLSLKDKMTIPMFAKMITEIVSDDADFLQIDKYTTLRTSIDFYLVSLLKGIMSTAIKENSGKHHYKSTYINHFDILYMLIDPPEVKDPWQECNSAEDASEVDAKRFYRKYFLEYLDSVLLPCIETIWQALIRGEKGYVDLANVTDAEAFKKQLKRLKVNWFEIDETEGKLYFVHYSFQEFFGALWVFRELSSQLSGGLVDQKVKQEIKKLLADANQISLELMATLFEMLICACCDDRRSEISTQALPYALARFYYLFSESSDAVMNKLIDRADYLVTNRGSVASGEGKSWLLRNYEDMLEQYFYFPRSPSFSGAKVMEDSVDRLKYNSLRPYYPILAEILLCEVLQSSKKLRTEAAEGTCPNNDLGDSFSSFLLGIFTGDYHCEVKITKPKAQKVSVVEDDLTNLFSEQIFGNNSTKGRSRFAQKYFTFNDSKHNSLNKRLKLDDSDVTEQRIDFVLLPNLKIPGMPRIALMFEAKKVEAGAKAETIETKLQQAIAQLFFGEKLGHVMKKSDPKEYKNALLYGDSVYRAGYIARCAELEEYREVDVIIPIGVVYQPKKNEGKDQSVELYHSYWKTHSEPISLQPVRDSMALFQSKKLLGDRVVDTSECVRRALLSLLSHSSGISKNLLVEMITVANKRAVEVIESRKSCSIDPLIEPIVDQDTQEPHYDSEIGRIYPVKADGNCFFRAVARALNEREGVDTYKHTDLRQRAIEHLQRHPELLSEFPPENETPSQYLERMAQVGTWVEGAIVRALGLSLNRAINVFYQDMSSSEFIIDQAGSDPIVLLLKDQHYQLLEPNRMLEENRRRGKVPRPDPDPYPRPSPVRQKRSLEDLSKCLSMHKEGDDPSNVLKRIGLKGLMDLLSEGDREEKEKVVRILTDLQYSEVDNTQVSLALDFDGFARLLENPDSFIQRAVISTLHWMIEKQFIDSNQFPEEIIVCLTDLSKQPGVREYVKELAKGLLVKCTQSKPEAEALVFGATSHGRAEVAGKAFPNQPGLG